MIKITDNIIKYIGLLLTYIAGEIIKIMQIADLLEPNLNHCRATNPIFEDIKTCLSMDLNAGDVDMPIALRFYIKIWLSILFFFLALLLVGRLSYLKYRRLKANYEEVLKKNTELERKHQDLL